jgi:hypothetical protein
MGLIASACTIPTHTKHRRTPTHAKPTCRSLHQLRVLDFTCGRRLGTWTGEALGSRLRRSILAIGIELYHPEICRGLPWFRGSAGFRARSRAF